MLAKVGFSRRRLIATLVHTPLISVFAGTTAWGDVSALPNVEARSVIALDWAFVETLLALGIPPIAVPATADYDRWVVRPPLPAGVVDVGSVSQPNLELLQDLQPDLFVISPAQEAIRPILERIAPTLTLTIYSLSGQPYQNAEIVTTRLGKELGGVRSAAELLAESAAEIRKARLDLSDRQRPIYLIRILDDHHVHVYGAKSMAQDVMDRIGVRNAWRGQTSYWGMAVVSVDELAGNPDASLIYVEPLPIGIEHTLMSSPLWRNLPSVRHDRVHALPPFWSFGGLPSATRFAGLLACCLSHSSEHQ